MWSLVCSQKYKRLIKVLNFIYVVYSKLIFPMDECNFFSFFMGVFTILGTMNIKVKSFFPSITCNIQGEITLGWIKNRNCKVHFGRFFSVFLNLEDFHLEENLKTFKYKIKSLSQNFDCFIIFETSLIFIKL